MGSPAHVAFVELGPGRGTLMADALRAMRVAPGLREAVAVHLVETSPTLRARQRATLEASGAAPSWHDALAGVLEGPFVLVANEFLDALPVRQFERRGGRWRERVVGLAPGGGLALGLTPDPAPDRIVPASLREAPEGAVYERAPAREAVAAEIGGRLARAPGAALLIDYGYAGPALGDTFQAVAGHAFTNPFASPGEADLTSHVDFGAVAETARQAGAAAFGPLEQGAFLRALGVETRAAALARGKPPEVAAEIASALDRLTGEAGMGRLFKALALASPGLPAPPPFA
jgi:NADH dehydrogenase [ubiquinone] 1 alpha subcomplex assembly factor 7